jgi:hypothetical protein
MQLDPIPHAAIVALHNRAKQLVLTQAWLGRAEGLRFAQGALSQLSDLLFSNGPACVAQRDASLGGYKPLAGFEAAWATLPVNAKNLTLAEVREFLVAQGVELSADAIPHFQADAVEQLKDDMVAVVNTHNEHDSASADLGNGSGLHSSSLMNAAIVAQGGAA